MTRRKLGRARKVGQAARVAGKRKAPTKMTTVRLLPHQLEALHAEAEKRAREKGLHKLDQSEVIRDALDAYFSKK